MDSGGLREESCSPALPPSRPAERVGAVDAFRGLTIILMILVNNPGSGDFVLPELRHAPWHGWTVADLVFPFFLFIMGSAMAFSLPGSTGVGGGRGGLYRKIIRRALILFSLGFLANLLPSLDFSRVRIFGVLQRIAFVYLIASMIVIHFGRRWRIAWTGALFFLYWIAMAWIPFPGMGPDLWAKGSNLAQYLDILVLGAHTWVPGLDPEGILGTIPAAVSAMSGYFAGEILSGKEDFTRKNMLLIASGAGMIIASLLVSPFMPVNKQLWTGTYSLLTGGIAFLILWLLCLAMEKGAPGYFHWLRIFGYNAITLYILSIVIAKFMRLFTVSDAPGSARSLKAHLFREYLAGFFGPAAGSVAYSLMMLLLLAMIAFMLYRKGIRIRI